MKRENSRYSFVKCTFMGSYIGFHVFFLENNLFHVVYTLCMRWIVFCRGLLYCVIKLFKFYQCSLVHYTSVGICTCTCWIYSKNTVQGVLTSKKIKCIVAMKVKLHNRQSFLKKIFLNRNENKFYSVDFIECSFAWLSHETFHERLTWNEYTCTLWCVLIFLDEHH